LYSVRHGATTIWERWDGWTEENGFQDPGMNSFNHYAYGAIGTWMYENIVGIRTDPKNPGFKHFILKPNLGGGLSYANGDFRCPYGLIQSRWRFEEETFIWQVTVPPNTTATVHLPFEEGSRILEGDHPVNESLGVKFIRQTHEWAVFRLQSGSYHFITRK
jgi:alpha-L-rhamnosidase